MTGGTALIIFIKNAEKGKVKTRLAQTIGEERALEIYLILLAHTRKLSLGVPTQRLLFYSDFVETADQWPEPDFQKFVQDGDDLGQRMFNAFKIALEKYHKAIIIGSDCANLTSAIIEKAFLQLDHYDFVLGPATDGGYYLLGMTAAAPSLFENMEWSTDEVLATTLSRMRNLGKTCYLLPELSDIDFEEDWKKYGRELEGGT